MRTEPSDTSDSITKPAAVVRTLLRLSWPAVMTSLLQTLVFLVDRVLLGRYSQDALASMQVQGPLVWSLFSVLSGAVVGVVPLVARHVGARDQQQARDVVLAGLLLAAGLGVGLGIAVAVFLKPIVQVLGPESESVRGLSEQYLSVVVWALPSMFVATTAALCLSAAGNTRTPFLVGVVSNGLNVLVSYVLIFGVETGDGRVLELGVRGAAIGSAVALAVEAVLLLIALRSAWELRLPRGREVWQRVRSAFRRVLSISTPAVGERVAIHTGFLAYVAVINALGPLVMASNQALVTLESVCFMTADGFGIATAAVVGQALGRQEPKAARLSGFLGALLGVVVLSSFGCLLWLFGPTLLHWFTPSGMDGSALRHEAARALPILFLSQPFMAVSIILSQALRGAGDTRSPLFSAILFGLGVRVFLAWHWGIRENLGITAIWAASLVDWICRAGFMLLVFQRGRWRNIRI